MKIAGNTVNYYATMINGESYIYKTKTGNDAEDCFELILSTARYAFFEISAYHLSELVEKNEDDFIIKDTVLIDKSLDVEKFINKLGLYQLNFDFNECNGEIIPYTVFEQLDTYKLKISRNNFDWGAKLFFVDKHDKNQKIQEVILSLKNELLHCIITIYDIYNNKN